MPRERVPRAYRYTDSSTHDRGGLGEDREGDLWIETLDGTKHETLQDWANGSRDFERRVVPAGHVFVMGDNRDNSSDSRVWGYVDRDLIKGKALIVWWSRDSSGGLAEFFGSIRWKRFFQLVK